MKAFALRDFGTPPELVDVPAPEPGPGEVLVEVHASSLNGFDVMVASGSLEGMMEHQFPVVIGKDFAGTVAAVGEGVGRFAPGERVFGVVMRSVLHDGAWAEYVTSTQDLGVAHMPEGLDFAAAGALGLAGTTALQSVAALALIADDTVLISGATGGVGAIAIQLAADRGATVLATAKPGPQADFVRSLGAHEAVDYTGDLPAAVRALRPHGVSAALHFAGDPADLVALVAPGGRIASAVGFSQEQAGEADVHVTGIGGLPDRATLDRLAQEIVTGRLRVPIQHSYPLAQAAQALADFADGKLGKISIRVAD